MKNRIFCMIISAFLSIALLVSVIPISVAAVNKEAIEIASQTEDGTLNNAIVGGGSFETIGFSDTATLRAGEKSFAELQTMTLDLATLPETIDVAHAQAKGHVNRVYEQENTLSTVIYQNRDGTKSTYFFARPVKYVSADGTVRDKSSDVSSIVNTLYSHAMLDNSTKVYFGSKATNGTMIQFGSYTIEMVPKTTVAAAAVQQEDGSIVYGGVFGEGTAVRYQTQLNGLKEDIVLIHNVGKSTFDFALQVTNATAVQEDGVWHFENAEGDIVASLGRIWVKDSAGHTTEGTISLTPTDLVGVYDVCVSVSELFLDDSSTVYPVYIDPTTYIFEEDYYFGGDGYEYPFDAILDTGLYDSEAEKDEAYGHSDYHALSEDGRIIYRFPSFYGTYTWDEEPYHYSYDYTLTAEQIGRATLYFEEREQQDFSVCVMHMTDTWDSTLEGEDPIALYDPDLWDSYTLDMQQYYTLDYIGEAYRSIDVTNFFREWARYNTFERSSDSIGNNPYYNPAYGFVMIFDRSCQITAVDAYDAMNVYVELDTSYFGGDFTINNTATGLFLKNNVITTNGVAAHSPTVESFNGQELPPNYLWRLEYLGDDQYYIRSCVDTDYMLYSAGTTLNVRKMIPNLESRYRWTISVASNGSRAIKSWDNRVLRSDGSSLTLSTALSSTDTNYAQTTWGISFGSEYAPMMGFEITSPDWVILGEANPRAINIKASPPDAALTALRFFTWSSDNTGVAIVTANGYVQGISPGIATITLTHRLTGLSATVTVYVQEVLEDGVYFVARGMGNLSPYYLTPESTQTNIGTELKYRVEQRHFSLQTQQWQITHIGSGYYSIQSVHNGGYLSVYNASSVEGAPICLEPTFSIAKSSWAIVMTSDGNYKLLSRCGSDTDQCLTVPIADGADCLQSGPIKQAQFDNQWKLCKIKYQATINNYYDKGYLVKHGFSEAQAKEKIAAYSNYAVERYIVQFGLLITVNEAQYYNSPLDQCKGNVTIANVDVGCTCGQQHSYSGTIYKNFMDSYSGSATETNIYWTGHKVFLREDGGDVDGNVHRSFSCATMITMVDPESLTRYDFRIRKVLVHELGHQYGLRDHYHELEDETNSKSCYNKQYGCSFCADVKRSDTCIMNNSSERWFCGDCYAEVQTHLQEHHAITAS